MEWAPGRLDKGEVAREDQNNSVRTTTIKTQFQIKGRHFLLPRGHEKMNILQNNLFQNAPTEWNVNDILLPIDSIDQIDTLDSDDLNDLSLELSKVTLPDDWSESAHMLIEKLLDLKQPRLDDRMVDTLHMDRFLNLFLDFLVRIPRNVTDNSHTENVDNSNTENMSRAIFNNVNELRRSFNVTEILTSNNPPSVTLLQDKGTEICKYLFLKSNEMVLVNRLLLCFTQSSHASFHHFKKVFEVLLARFPTLVMDAVFSEPSLEYRSMGPCDENMFMEMTRWAWDAAISSVLIQIIFPPTRIGKLTRTERFAKVASLKLIETLLSLFVQSLKSMKENGGREEVCIGLVDFITRLVEEGSKTDESGVLFKNLEDQPQLVDPLVDVSCNSQRLTCRL